jgi:hypothetical protein
MVISLCIIAAQEIRNIAGTVLLPFFRHVPELRYQYKYRKVTKGSRKWYTKFPDKQRFFYLQWPTIRHVYFNYYTVIVAMVWYYVCVERANFPSPRRYISKHGAVVEWYWEGKAEGLGDKLVPAPFFLTPISHGQSPGLGRGKTTNRLRYGTTFFYSVYYKIMCNTAKITFSLRT